MKSKKTMNRIIGYMEAHLTEPLTVGELAKEAGYSQYHFMRLFKEHTHMTVCEYLCRRRLMKASEDILAGQRIVDAAMAYGWEYHSGFTKAFKREFGFCPSLLSAMRFSIEYLGGSNMHESFMTSTKIGTSKEALLEILQSKLKENEIIMAPGVLEQSYLTAEAAYNGVVRYSGEEYITHPLNTAILLTQMGAGADAVLASLFCDVGEKGRLPMDALRARLPEKVFELVEKVQNIQDFEVDLDYAPEDAVLVKMAERLHNMRTIQYIDKTKWAEKAKETLEYFLPLARRLNHQKLIDEMNDLSLKYLRLSKEC